MRKFNTEGPVVADEHYCIPPLERVDLDEILGLIRDKRYFVLHAPRQTGKTSTLLALRDLLNSGVEGDLQAFLQRIVNSGGRIEREYSLGRGRTDLLVVWPRQGANGPPDAADRIVIECKVLHRSLEHTIADGLVQTAAYMDRCAAGEGHLVVFDRSEGKAWEEKIFRRNEDVNGRTIAVWGM